MWHPYPVGKGMTETSPACTTITAYASIMHTSGQAGPPVFRRLWQHLHDALQLALNLVHRPTYYNHDVHV